METKIIHTIRVWLPWAIEDNTNASEYEILRKLANHCTKCIHENDSENALQVIKIMNLIYTSGSLHDRNAIENEFLEVLTAEEAPASLKEHMKILPEKLKEAYLKTILEN